MRYRKASEQSDTVDDFLAELDQLLQRHGKAVEIVGPVEVVGSSGDATVTAIHVAPTLRFSAHPFDADFVSYEAMDSEMNDAIEALLAS